MILAGSIGGVTTRNLSPREKVAEEEIAPPEDPTREHGVLKQTHSARASKPVPARRARYCC